MKGAPQSFRRVHPGIARAARAFLDLTQQAVAAEAGVARRTVHGLETKGSPTDENLAKILKVFEARGVLIVFDNNGRADKIDFSKNLKPSGRANSDRD
ncbi:helix-turn-helix domain-containing protein [Rhizobium leguminosarum]|nr:helix-turn-helix domain-containing protein [Rhizobium leguminosarum]UIK12557.1 helix-turn-helix domain-containing protein [Rhizobium leguminosarum]